MRGVLLGLALQSSNGVPFVQAQLSLPVAATHDLFVGAAMI